MQSAHFYLQHINMDITVLLLCTLLLPGVVPSDCFFDSQQYEGHMSTTINNHQCRPWSDVLTPGNPVTSNLPDNSLVDASNFCRDPDGKGHPWCYVSLKSLQQGWEFCNVPYCQECYYHGNSTAYNGHVSTPTPATTCQSWVNLHYGFQHSQFPDGSVGKARNFCRDPLRSGTLYCYVNYVRTDCNIPECAGACADDQRTNCAVIEASIGLCKDAYFSTTLCAKTCNKCGFGLLPAVDKFPPLDVCFDELDANCALLRSLICSNPHAARTLCPKTCNLCGTPTGSHVTAQHTTGTTTTPIPVWSPWGQYKCINVSNTCLLIRIRNCSTGNTTDCSGSHSSISSCTKDACPDYFITAAPTLSTPLTTGPEHCKDMVGVNCASPAVQHTLCPHGHYSRQFCRKTCGKCDLPALNITRDHCNDPVATDTMCPFMNQEICVCDDPDLRPVLCPHYCAGECGHVGHFVCGPPAVGRRKRLADLMKQQFYRIF